MGTTWEQLNRVRATDAIAILMTAALRQHLWNSVPEMDSNQRTRIRFMSLGDARRGQRIDVESAARNAALHDRHRWPDRAAKPVRHNSATLTTRRPDTASCMVQRRQHFTAAPGTAAGRDTSSVHPNRSRLGFRRVQGTHKLALDSVALRLFPDASCATVPEPSANGMEMTVFASMGGRLDGAEWEAM